MMSHRQVNNMKIYSSCEQNRISNCLLDDDLILCTPFMRNPAIVKPLLYIIAIKLSDQEAGLNASFIQTVI